MNEFQHRFNCDRTRKQEGQRVRVTSQFCTKCVAFALVIRAVQQEVLDRLDCYTLAVRADRSVGLADSEEMLIEANMSRSELK
jgi:hypothetical protein